MLCATERIWLCTGLKGAEKMTLPFIPLQIVIKE